MKKTSRTVALSLLLKPALLVALFGLLTRFTNLTGIDLGALNPVTAPLSDLTGLSYRNSLLLVVALLCYLVVQFLYAAFALMAGGVRHS